MCQQFCPKCIMTTRYNESHLWKNTQFEYRLRKNRIEKLTDSFSVHNTVKLFIQNLFAKLSSPV